MLNFSATLQHTTQRPSFVSPIGYSISIRLLAFVADAKVYAAYRIIGESLSLPAAASEFELGRKLHHHVNRADGIIDVFQLNFPDIPIT